MIWPAARAAAPNEGTITTTRATTIISLRGMHLSSPIVLGYGRVRPLPIFSVGAANAPCPKRLLAKAVRRLDEPTQGDADALAEAVAEAEAEAVVEADAGFGRIRFAP